MSRLIAFLRAINAGGNRTVKMEALRQVFTALGFAEVTTVMASGNVVFETAVKNTRALERKIEKRLREALGYEVETFIRTDKELAQIAAYRPFRPSELDATAECNVIFLAEALDEGLKCRVRALRTDTHEFRAHGREIYWLRRKRPDGAAFSTVPLEKALGKPFTVRGSRTVLKIALEYCAGKK